MRRRSLKPTEIEAANSTVIAVVTIAGLLAAAAVLYDARSPTPGPQQLAPQVAPARAPYFVTLTDGTVTASVQSNREKSPSLVRRELLSADSFTAVVIAAIHGGHAIQKETAAEILAACSLLRQGAAVERSLLTYAARLRERCEGIFRSWSHKDAIRLAATLHREAVDDSLVGRLNQLVRRTIVGDVERLTTDQASVLTEAWRANDPLLAARVIAVVAGALSDGTPDAHIRALAFQSAASERVPQDWTEFDQVARCAGVGSCVASEVRDVALASLREQSEFARLSALYGAALTRGAETQYLLTIR